MSFDPNKPDFRYNLQDFREGNVFNSLKRSIDPNSTLNKVKVEYHDDRLRRFYLRHIFKDLESIKTSADLSPSLQRLYENFRRSQTFKNLIVTFEPEEDGSLKLILKPEYGQKTNFAIVHSSLLDSFGFLGTFTINNVVGFLDRLSINYANGTYGNLNNSYFMTYLLPVIYKDYNLEFSAGRQAYNLSRSVTEKSSFQIIRFHNNFYSFQLTNTNRWNKLDPIYHSKEAAEQEIYPNRKLSLSFSRLWPIMSPEQSWVNVLQFKEVIGTVESAGQFLKHEFSSHALFYPFLNFREKLRNICFENHLSCGITHPIFRSRIKMNDRFFRTDLPGFSEIGNTDNVYDKNLHPIAGNLGFEYLGDYKGDDIFLKNTIRIDFKNCPVLENIDVEPFLYLSYGYFSGNVMNKWLDSRKPDDAAATARYQSFKSRCAPWIEDIKKKSRISAGIGIFRVIDSAYNIEGLLNLYSHGARTDSPARFQLRLTINE